MGEWNKRLQDPRLLNHRLFDVPYHVGLRLAPCESLSELDVPGAFSRIVDYF